MVSYDCLCVLHLVLVFRVMFKFLFIIFLLYYYVNTDYISPQFFSISRDISFYLGRNDHYPFKFHYDICMDYFFEICFLVLFVLFTAFKLSVRFSCNVSYVCFDLNLSLSCQKHTHNKKNFSMDFSELATLISVSYLLKINTYVIILIITDINIPHRQLNETVRFFCGLNTFILNFIFLCTLFKL